MNYKPMGMSLMESEPHLELSEDKLKAVKDWDVGKKYTLTLNVTMHEKELYDGTIKGCFVINKVSVV